MRNDIMGAARLDLPAGTRLLLCTLIARQSRGPHIDVTVEALAKDLNVTTRSVRRALTELVEAGYIGRETVKDDMHGGYLGVRVTVNRDCVAA